MYPVKATLKNLDNEQDPEFVFQFNPTEIAISRAVNWGGGASAPPGKAPAKKGKAAPSPVSFETGIDINAYGSTEPYNVTINKILFDTFEDRSTVDYYILRLKETVTPSIIIGPPAGSKATNGSSREPRKRPARYVFTFGNYYRLPCVVKSLAWTYSVWLPDGTPLRAMVNLVLQETILQAKGKSDGPGPKNAIRTGSTFSIASSLNLGANLDASFGVHAGVSLSANLDSFV